MAITHQTAIPASISNNPDKAVSKNAWEESHAIGAGTIVSALFGDTAADQYFGYVVFGYNNGSGQPNAATQAKINAIVAQGIDTNRIAWVDLGDGNGTFGFPSFGVQTTFVAPTLTGVQLGSFAVPSFTVTGTLTAPAFEGLVAPPLSTLTWTMVDVVTDSILTVGARTAIATLTAPALKGGMNMTVDARTAIATLSPPTLIGTSEVSSTLNWYVLSVS